MELKDQNNPELPINPYAVNDGITHINMKTFGQTEVGRLLSMEAPNRFTHPVFGSFDSLEGFWYYIRSGCQDTKVRTSNEGYGRRRFGNQPTEKIENFQEIIGEGIYIMLCQLPDDRLQLILDNELPLDMYYIHYGKDESGKVVSAIVQRQRHHQWYLPLVEKVIQLIRDDKPYPEVDYGKLLQQAQ